MRSPVRRMKTLARFFLLLSTFVREGSFFEYTRTAKRTPCEAGHCYTEDDGPCMDDGKPKLYRWDPVKVGHVRHLELEKNKMFKMTTRALRPPVFEIPNFLTDEEADHVVNVSEEVGMFKSFLHMDPISKEHRQTLRAAEGHSNSSAGYFRNWDFDGDYEISKDEIIKFGIKFKHLYLTKEEVEEMITFLDIKEMEDGKIEYREWRSLKTQSIDMYMNDLKEHHPHHRDRFSEQAWLFQGKKADDVMRRLRARVWKLTRLPMRIMYGSEPMQVVKYGPYGHYHAHFDATRRSDFPDSNCCHFDLLLVPHCRLCRYITVLYYLNDVEGGGETAFPVADDMRFNETKFRDRKQGDRYNLREFCQTANLVIKPEKGKAIMWYNFEQDGKTGWMGPRDDNSLHGGCVVTKGTKFIANNWIPAPEPDTANLDSDYLDETEIERLEKLHREAVSRDGDNAGD